VTNDLAIGLRVSLESAEKIKIALSDEKMKGEIRNDLIEIADLGSAEPKKVSRRTLIEGIIRPRLNEIFTMVKLDLERNGLINRIPSGAVITGGGALTIACEDAARRMLSLPVRVGKPQRVGGLVDDIMNPSFASAVGLIIYGTKAEPKESLPSFGKRFKLPGKGALGKLVETIKDLLP
jgi:cell division protein FtsA